MSSSDGASRQPSAVGPSVRRARTALTAICMAAFVVLAGCSGSPTDAPDTPSLTSTSSTPAAPQPSEAPEAVPTAAPEPVDQGPQIPAGHPCPPEATACVDLTNGLTWLQSNGQVSYGPVQMHAGMEGYRTPVGMYTVYRKVEMDYSRPFNNEPMPFSVYFNNGIAFHEGSMVEPSHGCIHLEHAAAIHYFQTLQSGHTVFVYGNATY